jgi:hypothetical protein
MLTCCTFSQSSFPGCPTRSVSTTSHIVMFVQGVNTNSQGADGVIGRRSPRPFFLPSQAQARQRIAWCSCSHESETTKAVVTRNNN